MEKNLFDVKGKVVVMTGACGVLGSTIVKYFAAQGCKVVLLDLERAAAIGETLVKEIEAEGGDAAFFPTNVLDKAALELNYQQIMEKYGKIDILLNAAGGNMASATVPPDKTIFDLDVEAVKKVTELNLFGTIIPTMVSRNPWQSQVKVPSSILLPSPLSVRSRVWPVTAWPRLRWLTGPNISVRNWR